MRTLAQQVALRGALSPRDAVGWALRFARTVEGIHLREGAHGGLSATSVAMEFSSPTKRGALISVPTEPNYTFRSPERGNDGPPSRADDTWAVATTFYLILTGQHPWDAPTPAEIQAKMAVQHPPELGKFGRHDDDLQALFDTALARDRGRRLTVMAELRERLEAYCDRAAPQLKALPPLDIHEDASALGYGTGQFTVVGLSMNGVPPPRRSKPPPLPVQAPPAQPPAALESVLPPSADPSLSWLPEQPAAAAPPAIALPAVAPKKQGSLVVVTIAMVAAAVVIIGGGVALVALRGRPRPAPQPVPVVATIAAPVASPAVVAAVASSAPASAPSVPAVASSSEPVVSAVPVASSAPAIASSAPAPAVSSAPVAAVSSAPVAASAPVASASAAPVAASGDAGACIAGLLPEDAFPKGPTADVSAICTDTDIHHIAGTFRAALVRAKQTTGASLAMTEWARLGWFDIATIAFARGRCCGDVTPYPPQPIGACGAFEDVLAEIATLPADADDAAIAAVADKFVKGARCLVSVSAGIRYSHAKYPDPGDSDAFKKLVARNQKR